MSWLVSLVAAVMLSVSTPPLPAPAPARASAMASGTGTAEVVRPQLPPLDAGFDYQLGGAYPPPLGVSVLTRDRTAAPAAGAYNICYVNGFQTQPGQLTWWRTQHDNLLLRDGSGALVHDRGWPGEVLLDVSTALKRRQIGVVLGRWVNRCADDGFDAVEPDNLDSFSRSRNLLSRSDDLALASLLATRAHHVGLAIAQKNLASLSRSARVRTGFDFAVSEECAVWHECSSYRSAYGKHVLEIEYTDNGRRAFSRACADHGVDWSVILRDRMLRTPSSPRYTYRSC